MHVDREHQLHVMLR